MSPLTARGLGTGTKWPLPDEGPPHSGCNRLRTQAEPRGTDSPRFGPQEEAKRAVKAERAALRVATRTSRQDLDSQPDHKSLVVLPGYPRYRDVARRTKTSRAAANVHVVVVRADSTSESKT